MVFNIDPTNYLADVENGCLLLVHPRSENSKIPRSVVLGYPFLSAFYSGFSVSNTSVAIAPILNSLSSVTTQPLPIKREIIVEDHSDPEPFPIWAILLIVVALLASIFALFFILNRHRKHRKHTTCHDEKEPLL